MLLEENIVPKITAAVYVRQSQKEISLLCSPSVFGLIAEAVSKCPEDLPPL
jgi:hypothetical protein